MGTDTKGRHVCSDFRFREVDGKYVYRCEGCNLDRSAEEMREIKTSITIYSGSGSASASNNTVRVTEKKR